MKWFSRIFHQITYFQYNNLVLNNKNILYNNLKKRYKYGKLEFIDKLFKASLLLFNLLAKPLLLIPPTFWLTKLKLTKLKLRKLKLTKFNYFLFVC